jgi:hypothetical protein
MIFDIPMGLLFASDLWLMTDPSTWESFRLWRLIKTFGVPGSFGALLLILLLTDRPSASASIETMSF